MRPGQTIPVIGPDGKPKYNDALNTSFGAPPVLVLRIGDFFHTKIIPNSLGITYDPLLFDINPEGIGVQPMIAKISLNFDFIGGHGIAGPVNQLQNALSFNYYANTEIYDERSVPTENTKERDENLVKQTIQGGSVTPDPLMANQVQNQIPQKGGSTIGTISSTNTSADGSIQTGEIEYKELIGELSTKTQEYFKTMVNQLKTITSTTNKGITDLVSTDLEFNTGEFNEYGDTPTEDIPLYGKSNSVEKYIKSLVSDVKKDVNDETAPIIEEIVKPGYSFKNNLIRDLKNSLESEVAKSESELNSIVIGPMNTITSYQETYNYTFRKLDVVSISLDGVKLESGDYKVYTLSGNTPDVITNITKAYTTTVGDKLKSFSNDILNGKLLGEYKTAENLFTIVYTGNLAFNAQSNRFYSTMSHIFLDENKYNAFVDTLLTEKIKKESQDMVDLIKKECEYWKTQFKLEHDAEIKVFDDFEKSSEYKPYETFKIEEFDTKISYTTDNVGNNLQKKNRLKNLYSDVNVNASNKTYNGKVKFN